MAAASGTVIDRLSPGDRTVLATDRGSPPMQIAALLEFGPGCGPTVAELTAVIGERLPRVPRLRQRLTAAPFGGGRAYWTDDPAFELDRHLLRVDGVAADDGNTGRSWAAELLCRPLDRHRPLWQLGLLVDEEGLVGSLVVVLHHVLADGVAGLAALAALTDLGGHQMVPDANRACDPVQPAPFPRRPPRRIDVVRDRVRSLRCALAGTPGRLRHGLDGLAELGFGAGLPRLAPATTLNVPTGPRRRIAVVRSPMADLSGAAHRAGGTVNDVLLAVITGAMLRTLRNRGECPKRLVVSVPVAGGSTSATGNHAGVRPVTVPSITNDAARLRFIVRLTRQQRATLRRASSTVPLGYAFRALARAGLFGWFIDHQRLVHTFASNLRGPAAPLSFGGHRVRHLTAMSVTPGNVGVSFTAVSYAGEMGLTVVADPDICDPEPVAAAAAEALDRLLSDAR